MSWMHFTFPTSSKVVGSNIILRRRQHATWNLLQVLVRIRLKYGRCCSSNFIRFCFAEVTNYLFILQFCNGATFVFSQSFRRRLCQVEAVQWSPKWFLLQFILNWCPIDNCDKVEASCIFTIKTISTKHMSFLCLINLFPNW